MSQVSRAQPLSAAPVLDLAAQLAGYRAHVTEMLKTVVPEREPRRALYDILRALLANQGKGIRPALCLATCGAFGGDLERAVPSATAIELLHNAFLVHDDVEDESEFRRGVPTLHRTHGVPLAVNVGDALNALSVRVLRRNLPLLGIAPSLRIFDEFDHMSAETIEGQAMELGWIRDNYCETTEEDYLLMVLKKTGWYSFIHPARIGALIADPERDDLDAFNRFGYYLGAAFQIQDDVLNLVGDQRKYGKEIGGDIQEGKRTLIIAHAFAHSDDRERERLRTFFSKSRAERMPREVSWVRGLLEERRSIDYARCVARELGSGAKAELERAYAGARQGDDLSFVRALVDHVSTREA